MKFQANRDVLSEAVTFAVKLLPQRTTLPILSGILIEANDDTITLSAFDYEVSAQTKIVAHVEEPGTVLVSGRLLAEIANRLPNAPVEFETDAKKVMVSCGSARFTLASMPAEEYPKIPVPGETTGTIPADVFSTAISQVALAASRDDVTPVITGVQLEIMEDKLALIATDRYRVAVREIAWNSAKNVDEKSRTALIPSKTLSEVGKIFGHGEAITVSLSGSDDRELIAFSADEKTVTTLLIKGNFPPVRRLFPETTEHFAVMNTAELVEATRRVSLVLDRESALRFSFSDNNVVLEALSSEHAQASESIEAVMTGEDTVVSLKPQFLLDGLSAVPGEFVRIAFTKTDNPNKPGPVLLMAHNSLEGQDANSYRYLLQPNLLMR